MEMTNLKDRYQSAQSKPKTPVDMNPTSQDGDTFFMDPALLPEGHKCKVGEELLLRVSVKSKGSKIGVTPIEVVENETPEEDAPAESGPMGMPGGPRE